jgi:hypothetical protein
MSAKGLSTIAALGMAALALGACGPLRGQRYHEPVAVKAAPVSPSAAVSSASRQPGPRPAPP